MNQSRQKIKLYKRSHESALEFATVLVLLIIWGYTLFSFSQLPNEIPVHFNASGEADRYGDKQSVFLLPIISTVLSIGLFFLNTRPHIFNYLTEITEPNAKKQYTNPSRLIRILNLLMVIVFAYLTFTTISDEDEALGTWFLPTFTIIFNLPGIYYMIKSFKK